MTQPESRLYGLIGKNISYSFSPNYFKSKFERLKLNSFKYELFDLEQIEDFEQIIQLPNLSGLNVTIPYKENIIPFLNSVSKKAKKIGAVNTIRIKADGTTKGYNTDWYGFQESLLPLISEHHKKALILGKGGASKAIAFALNRMEIEYEFVSRNPLATELAYQDISAELLKEYQIVINCTPLGTFPNLESCPEIDYSGFTSKHIAYDLVYNPEKTEFLKRASNFGATIKNGKEMLELQAEKAWKIWNKI